MTYFVQEFNARLQTQITNQQKVPYFSHALGAALAEDKLDSTAAKHWLPTNRNAGRRVTHNRHDSTIVEYKKTEFCDDKEWQSYQIVISGLSNTVIDESPKLKDAREFLDPIMTQCGLMVFYTCIPNRVIGRCKEDYLVLLQLLWPNNAGPTEELKPQIEHAASDILIWALVTEHDTFIRGKNQWDETVREIAEKDFPAGNGHNVAQLQKTSIIFSSRHGQYQRHIQQLYDAIEAATGKKPAGEYTLCNHFSSIEPCICAWVAKGTRVQNLVHPFLLCRYFDFREFTADSLHNKAMVLRENASSFQLLVGLLNLQKAIEEGKSQNRSAVIAWWQLTYCAGLAEAKGACRTDLECQNCPGMFLLETCVTKLQPKTSDNGVTRMFDRLRRSVCRPDELNQSDLTSSLSRVTSCAKGFLFLENHEDKSVRFVWLFGSEEIH